MLLACPKGMTIPSNRNLPASAGLAPVSSRDEMLDDTIENSFPASDPPSSIPDPGPEESYAAPIERAAGGHLLLWAAIAGAAVSALWLGLNWQRRRLD